MYAYAFWLNAVSLALLLMRAKALDTPLLTWMQVGILITGLGVMFATLFGFISLFRNITKDFRTEIGTKFASLEVSVDKLTQSLNALARATPSNEEVEHLSRRLLELDRRTTRNEGAIDHLQVQQQH